jgi:hypothetical protein
MFQKMQITLNTRGSCRVSLQCEISNVCSNEMIEKTTLDTEGRYEVSHQCELSYVFSDDSNKQMIFCIYNN